MRLRRRSAPLHPRPPRPSRPWGWLWRSLGLLESVIALHEYGVQWAHPARDPAIPGWGIGHSHHEREGGREGEATTRRSSAYCCWQHLAAIGFQVRGPSRHAGGGSLHEASASCSVGQRWGRGARACIQKGVSEAHQDNPSMVLMQLDFQNAFNTVSRDVMLKQVRELRPQILSLSRPVLGMWGSSLLGIIVSSPLRGFRTPLGPVHPPFPHLHSGLEGLL
jgi:hypothetical protein